MPCSQPICLKEMETIIEEERYDTIVCLYRIRKQYRRMGLFQPDFLCLTFGPLLRSKKLTRTDGNMFLALSLWNRDAKKAEEKYGHISKWDTSLLTDSGLSGRTLSNKEFNEDLSNWDLRSTDLGVHYASFFQECPNMLDCHKPGYREHKDWLLEDKHRRWNGDINAVFKLWYTNKIEAEEKYGQISKWDMSRVTDIVRQINLNDVDDENLDLSEWNLDCKTLNYHTLLNGLRTIHKPGYGLHKDWLVEDKHRRWNGDIYEAVNEWCENSTAAEAKYGHISKWDTSHVTEMVKLFESMLFNEDISEWDVSNVTDMTLMFYKNVTFNGDISRWNVSSVTTMSWMFASSTYNGDISKWNVSNVTTMTHMFAWSHTFNGDISRWNVSQVKNMCMIFCEAKVFNGDISRWDVSQVKDMWGIFNNAEVFNGDISEWNVSSVTRMGCMFNRAKLFNGDISKWNVSNVNDMSTMFASTDSFNGDISRWDVSNVTTMYCMFSGTKIFNADISRWDVSKVESMGQIFKDAKSFNADISRWSAPCFSKKNNGSEHISAFENCPISSTHKPGYSQYKDWLIEDKHRRWNGDIYEAVNEWCENSTAAEAKYGHISKWDTSHVTSMNNLFNADAWHDGSDNRRDFNDDISNWNVSSVTSMNDMFNHTALFNVDISKWDVSNVTEMSSMFYNAKGFNRNLTSWKVSEHTYTSYIFDYSSMSNENKFKKQGDEDEDEDEY
jgi:surface protein